MEELEESAIDDIHAVIAEMTRSSRPKRPATRLERLSQILVGAFVVVEILCVIILMAALGMHNSLGDEKVLHLTVKLGYAMSVAAILAMLGVVLSCLPFLLKLRKDPFFALLDLVRTDMRLYAGYVSMFHRYPKPLLEYTSLNFSVHREGLEGRLALLIGEIKKIGLFPGLLAVAIGAQKLVDGSAPWLWLPIILTGCFYFMSFAAADKPAKMDHVARILQYAIEHYPENPKADGDSERAGWSPSGPQSDEAPFAEFVPLQLETAGASPAYARSGPD